MALVSSSTRETELLGILNFSRQCYHGPTFMLLVSFSNVRKEEKKKILWSELPKGKGNVTRTFRCASRLFGTNK